MIGKVRTWNRDTLCCWLISQFFLAHLQFPPVQETPEIAVKVCRICWPHVSTDTSPRVYLHCKLCSKINRPIPIKNHGQVWGGGVRGRGRGGRSPPFFLLFFRRFLEGNCLSSGILCNNPKDVPVLWAGSEAALSPIFFSAPSSVLNFLDPSL